MKRQIVMCTFVLAAVMAPSDGPAVAEARARQVDAGESQVHANGITIAYRSYGSADRETILLIMGVGGQLTEWPAELPAELVKRGYRVVIYDNRDAGLSTRFDSSGLPEWPAIFAALGAGKSAHLAYSLERHGVGRRGPA